MDFFLPRASLGREGESVLAKNSPMYIEQRVITSLRREVFVRNEWPR